MFIYYFEMHFTKRKKKKGLVNGVFNFGEFYLFVFYLVLSGVD